LTKRTRGVVDAAGAAAYVKDPLSGQFRAVVRWNGEESMAHAQNFIPRAIDEVIDRNELVMLGDVGPPLAHEEGKANARSHALLGHRYLMTTSSLELCACSTISRCGCRVTP
jgi:hypothetical protein